MVKRVLVTGARGFIGRHMLPILHDKGFEVHALDLEGGESINSNTIWHNANLLRENEIENVMQIIKPTHLLHLAWYTASGFYWKSLENITWVQNSLSLLKSFAGCGGLRCVIAGSCAEYDWTYELLSESHTPIKPGTIYGICKDSLHRLVNGFAKETGLSYAWGRIFFLYGPYEKEDRLVPYVIKSLLKNKVAQCSSGTQIRDYLFVHDVANAFVELIDSPVQGAFNIGSGQGVSVKEIILKIGEKLNKSDLIEIGALQNSPDEPHVVLADTSKIYTETIWRPKVLLDDGLNQTIQWYKEYYKVKA